MTTSPDGHEPDSLPLESIFHDPSAVDGDVVRESVIASGVWFVDIPRTSSSSIRVDLARRFGEVHGKKNVLGEAGRTAVFRSHVPARLMREFIGADAWSRLFTFSIVRNPWARIRSLYHFRRLRENIPASWSLGDYVHALRHADADSPFFKFDGFRYGCVDYLMDEEGHPLVTHTIRYEERAAALARIGRQLGCAHLGRQIVQQASPAVLSLMPGVDVDAAFDFETAAIIGERYHADVETYGYSFEASRSAVSGIRLGPGRLSVPLPASADAA
jgi:hypothetical protein